MPGMGEGGNKLFIDTTFTDPRKASNDGRAAVIKNVAILNEVEMKNNKYRDLCHSLGYSFLAAAIEIFGSMAKELVALIKKSR